jgi:hypothetical protein
MTQKYLRAKNVTLPTDVKVTFDYRTKIANVIVKSLKCKQDTNFEKPYNYGISVR